MLNNLQAVSSPVLASVVSAPALSAGVRGSLEAELGKRMQASARAEGHLRRLPLPSVEAECDPLGVEALEAYGAGMSHADIAFCLGLSVDRSRYLIEKARALGL